jgi:cytochrome P450
MSIVDAGNVDIYDPDWYVGGDVHGTFAELRRHDPVHWQDMPGQPGYWAVLRHADVVHVARHPEVFSAWLGSVVLEQLAEEQLQQMRHMLLVMDPPQHTQYRQPLAPHFGARVIGRMEVQIRDRCRAILEAAAVAGEVDFCHDVAGPLPAQIIGEIMGLPQEDTPMIQRWAELQNSGQDDEVMAGYEGNASVEMAMYGMAWATQRRAEAPREDLTSLILESTFEDGQQMTDLDFGSFFVQLVTAGNDTTKTMMSSGTYELVRNPDQLQALRDDRARIPTAVEEMLRYCNPLHYFRRTATQDVELGGKQIKAGDKVAMMYTAANRDPDVFADPERFDVSRTPNPHLSFGIGAHFCLGAHLARLEARIFFEELLSTFRTIELAGEPARVRSNLNNGFKRMPVRVAR